MYIDKYWGNYIGGSDDSLNLVEFLKDQNQDEIALAEIFTKIGLDKQNWDFRQTVGYLEYTNADGVDIDFHFAIDLVTDLAAILLECMVNGSVNLSDLDDYHTPSRKIRVTATVEEHDALNKSLADFAKNPLSYDLHELMDDDEIIEMAGQVEVLRRELYEAAGTNRNYHVKADDMRELLHDWEGADGCLATSRVMVEGYKVGFCYREQPDGDWDSGWRFTAGDESDEYMDDPMNSGIYKLNTVCNDDPDIIPLLTAPYNSAFERDENGVFRSVEDWQPSEAESADNADSVNNTVSVDNTVSISDLLARCQKWHEQGKYSKIIAELEALPDDLRTAETDCELARAYNNEANYTTPEGRRMLTRAVELLRAHEDELADDYSWNFRLAYAYYFLEREQLALPLFEKALELHPGDDPKLNTRQDIEELIESCKNTLTLPYFAWNFRQRTAEAWQVFAEEESALRELIDNNKDNDRGEELVEKCNEILKTAFSDIAFELGHNGDKYELILSSEGDRTQLFELVYFKRQMPEELGERWNILIGRQPSDKPQIVVNGVRLSGDDVSVLVEKHGKDNIGLTLYCEKLADSELLENQTEWMLTLLVDQALGEIPATRYIDSFDVANELLGDAITLSELPARLKQMGLDLDIDAEKYLDLYTGYEAKPDDSPEADPRLDVMAGSTNCMSLLSAYLNNDDEDIDKLHNDGIAAGFICYPLDSFKGKDRSDQIFDFREKLEDTFSSSCESDLTLTGGATGLYCGYVDFIAWDLEAVLRAAKAFFDDSDVEWAIFHSFRRSAEAITLKSPDSPDDDEPDDADNDDDNTGSNADYTDSDIKNPDLTDSASNTEEAEMKRKNELTYTPLTAEDFYNQIDKWTESDEYTKCIEALEAVPEEYRDYRYTYTFARTLENYAIIGDNDEGTPQDKRSQALLRAIELLESVRDKGQDLAAWNMRMAYGYQYLHDQEQTAIIYAKRWAELEPDNENAMEVIEELEKEIKRNQRKSAHKSFKIGDTPFEGFDFTEFWDDSEYALKEYVSDPPSDELIASVEEELGYKLPESYIWLMKRHNGGMPKNTCYPTDEPTSWAEDHVAITGIFGIGRDKECSLCGSLGSKFMIDEWEYPDIGVAVCDCPSAGHDMIFLDYTECGPDGEPKVVHVDQENDYKITLLADSFEEFIRGLLPESDFDDDYAYCDDDDDDDDDNDDDDCDCRNCDCDDCGDIDDDINDGDSDDSDNDENSHKGVFAGFVLMSKHSWDKEQLIHDLAEKWDITAQEDEDEDKRDDALVFDVDGMIAAISLMPYPIPDGEAEVNAENNYMWSEAVKAAKAHKAHIMVAVLGGNEEDLIERGKLYVKLVAACCRQKYATGVYTSGVVFEPRFYEGFADMLKDDELPIFNWIWFGLYRNEKGVCGYTYGMDAFGKDEIEVLDTDADPNDLRDFMASIVSYILDDDVELHDGETIGFSEDDKHKITRSKGVSLPEEQMTLKISYTADSCG